MDVDKGVAVSTKSATVGAAVGDKSAAVGAAVVDKGAAVSKTGTVVSDKSAAISTKGAVASTKTAPVDNKSAANNTKSAVVCNKTAAASAKSTVAADSNLLVAETCWSAFHSLSPTVLKPVLQPQMIKVQIPEGAKPGESFECTASDGSTICFLVPVGGVPGQLVHVPDLHAPQILVPITKVQKVCFRLAAPGGCPHGASCMYLHESPADVQGVAACLFNPNCFLTTCIA